MGDKKIVAVVIFLVSLVVSIPLVVINTYFINNGYDYQDAKLNTGLIIFFLGIPGYVVFKVIFRKKK